MSDNLTPAEIEKYIDRLATNVVDSGFEVPILFFLEILRPLGYIFSSTTLCLYSPFLELFGFPGYDLVQIFRDSKNPGKLIDKVEELREKRKIEEEREKNEENKEKDKPLYSITNFFKKKGS